MAVKTKYRRPVMIHSIANCHVCGWDCSGVDKDGYSCVKQVKEHVRRTGHGVTLETGYSQQYYKEE